VVIQLGVFTISVRRAPWPGKLIGTLGGAVGWWVPPPLGSTEKLGRSTLGSDGTAQRFYPYTAAGRPSLLHHLFLLSLLGALPIARF
jgi:hypothetical protein